MKKKLPTKKTFFVIEGKNQIGSLINGLIKYYELSDDEINWLKNEAIKLTNCNTLLWNPFCKQFQYIIASGGFLQYCWLSHGQPKIYEFYNNKFVYIYTDKINSEIFFDIEKSLK